MTTQTNNLQPAFRGASFDSSGVCIHHPEVKLSQKVNLNGRIVYKELRRVCPKCRGDDVSAASTIKSSNRMNSVGSVNRSVARSTVSNGTGGGSRRSDGTGSVKPTVGRSSTPGREARSGGANEGTPRSSSRSRARERTEEQESRGTARSKSKDRRRASSAGRSGARTTGGIRLRRDYDAPFDSKGRCHYHPQVQLANKKLLGGWNVLLDVCPKCMEESYVNDDNRSVASGRSNRTARSSKSQRGVFSKNNHQYESPFDSNGYCHRHTHVRLAKKKALGGWKIIQSFCAECAKEDACDENASDKSGRSRSSRVSKSSKRSGRSRYEEETTESAHSTSQSEQVKKKLVKKMRFRDGESGEEGFYTGYVNGEYQPHGRGKIVYENGDRFDGTWCEGSKVHGKTRRMRDDTSTSHEKDRGSSRRIKLTESSSQDGSTKQQQQQQQQQQQPRKSRRVKPTDNSSSHDVSASAGRSKQQQQQSVKQQMDEYRDMYTDVFPVILAVKKVKNMRFVDYYGDPGRYSGEVNDSNMPHGMGEMTYDHGLVQGGKWTNGVLDEGSIVSCPRSPRKQAMDYTADSTRRGSRVRDP